MDLAARKAANLSVLRRQDPDIVDLLDQSSHAVVYSFDLNKAGWAKKGIEGTVFLIQKNTPPYYGIYILNRLSIDNYRLIMNEDLVIEQQDEYIIYQTPNEDICCLWLYETGDRERICNKMIAMRDTSKQTKATKPTSIDVTTIFGNASSIQQTAVQTAEGKTVSLDQLFGNASLKSQPVPPPNPVGKPVNLAELFQSVNPPPKPQNVPATPQSMSINEMFNRATQQSQQLDSMSMPMPMPMPAPVPSAPAPLNGTASGIDPAAALLNTLRGGMKKETDVQQHYSPQQLFQQPQQLQQHQQHQHQQQHQQQRQPNPAVSLLDILKGAQPKREPTQEPAVTMQTNMQSGQEPVSHTPPRPRSLPVQQPSPQSNQPLAVLNGTRKPSTNSLLALLQGSNVNKPASVVSTPQSQSISPAMNGPIPAVKSASAKAPTAKPSLLDTLMGAGPAKPPSAPPVPKSMSPVRQTSSPSMHHPMSPSRRSISGAPPLELNQAQDLANAQIANRLKSPNVLSKPEFIQQFLNLIQSDATFLDTLYTDYVKQHPGAPSQHTTAQSPQYFGALYPGMSHQ